MNLSLLDTIELVSYLVFYWENSIDYFLIEGSITLLLVECVWSTECDTACVLLISIYDNDRDVRDCS